MTQPDYTRLIDAPTWAFIRATEAAYPPDTATLSIADQRAIYDRMCRAFFRGYPPGVTATDELIAGVSCRRSSYISSTAPPRSPGHQLMASPPREGTVQTVGGSGMQPDTGGS